MIAFDFFCGAGGLTRGLLDSGIKVLAGFDYDGNSKPTYEHNNGKAKFVSTDIRDVSVSDLKRFVDRSSFKEMLFSGCAPCQPFSTHKKNKGPSSEATLLSEFGRIVKEAKPGFVLIENVPGMAKVRGPSTFKLFLRLLENLDYKLKYDVLDAKSFGVPQTRRRLVLIASRLVDVTLPEPKFDGKIKPFRTVRQAISHFPPIDAGKGNPNVPNHVAASLEPINMERMQHTPPDGGDRRSWPSRLHLVCHGNDYEGHTDVYGRMAWDKPAPTLTGRCHSISNGRYGHPVQDRAISFREAAAIQSFPDAYEFFGVNRHIALQIGNAVPVKLAEVLGRHILHIDSKRRWVGKAKKKIIRSTQR